MKTNLALLTILLGCFAAHAQLVTNFIVQVKVDIVNTGVSTNSTQTTLNIKPDSSAKDKVLSDGIVWFYNRQKATANETNELSFWTARTHIKDKFKESADAKAREESSITLEKLSRLLSTDIDLLTAGDLSQLNTIAAKAP